MAMDSVSLADFLSRPVNIQTVNWLESDSVTAKLKTFYPWYDFFNTATIKYKLNNWAFIKCNLHLKFVYNSSPFYYGSLMSTYEPLSLTNPTFVDNNAAQLLQAIPYSQMQGRVMLEPQYDQNEEVVLPFFWPANFMRCQVANDFYRMGSVEMRVINALQSANGVTGQGITVQVFAWATDVVLSGPSVGVSLQSGVMDEYSMDGPISKPASAIANIAATLGKVPVLGRFATATAIGASAVGSIAKLFGFTNVPTIGDQHGFQPRALPPMASTDIGYPFEKLTVDSKNELTIDHRSVGLGVEDELPIASIVQRESFLETFSWTGAQTAGTLLRTYAVTPQLHRITSGTGTKTLFMTPMCWLSTMFNYWRGDVIFRFHVVASKYHRGRILLTYDPAGNATNLTTDRSTHLVMSQIVDISEDTDIEFKIPFQQYQAWLNNYTPSGLNEQFNGTSFSHVEGKTNGLFAISVFTVLTGPTSSCNVGIQMFVRGAENMDFASPNTTGLNLMTNAVVQAGQIEIPETQVNSSNSQEVAVGMTSRPVDHLYLTYMGERVASLRVLLRRQCKVFTDCLGSSAYNHTIRTLTLNRVPLLAGYDTNALNTAKGLVDTGTTFKFNWFQTSFLAYITPAFKGTRGSVNWSCVFDTTSTIPVRAFSVIRDKSAYTLAYGNNVSDQSTTSIDNKFFHTYTRSTGAGAAIATGQTANGANWQMPYYSHVKFQPTMYSKLCSQADTSDGAVDCFTTEFTKPPGNEYGRISYYAGAGTDFDLLKFNCVPTYTIMTSSPVAV